MPITRDDLIRYGSDSNGRPILMTPEMWVAWEAVLAVPRVKRFANAITIVQGPWMKFVPGGGAADSAGYHDNGGALDLRSWNLSNDQIENLIWSMNKLGWPAVWLRDAKHGGMSPHIHAVYAGDLELGNGVKDQIRSVYAGGDGLMPEHRDYHERPLIMPKELPKEKYMAVIDDFVEAFWNKPIMPVGGKAGDEIPARRMLAQIHNRTSDDNLKAAVTAAIGAAPAKPRKLR